ncbi:MAG: SDR family NAD(P)-dependent oxidoreductase [Arachnia sp.]
MTKRAIITGHTRGLGAALAAQLTDAGWEVLGIARTGGQTIDLGDPEMLSGWLDRGGLDAHLAGADEVLLINNAGVLGPADVAGAQSSLEIISAITVNVAAPLLLTNAVLRGRAADTPVRIAHVSSGAGRRPLPGWSVYCATKAALDHHATTVAAEAHDGVRIAAIAPGVVDTDMQGDIRASEGFPLRADFVAMKNEGRLATPEDAARAVLAVLDADDFGQNPVTSI